MWSGTFCIRRKEILGIFIPSSCVGCWLKRANDVQCSICKCWLSELSLNVKRKCRPLWHEWPFHFLATLLDKRAVRVAVVSSLINPKDDIEGKRIYAHHPSIHEVVAPVLVQKYRQPWNTVVYELLYSTLSATFEYVLKSISTAVSVYLIGHWVV